METIVLGGGCFWCLDASYKLIKGVKKVESGYSGGTIPSPTYELVCTGTTGHAEVVRISFDTTVISLHDIMNIFWALHDPTTPDRQGNDVGSQYRSVIFYNNEDQKKTAELSVGEAATYWTDHIVTQIVELDEFYLAEEYHQDYFANHPEQAYCQIVINPKLQKLRERFTELLA